MLFQLRTSCCWWQRESEWPIIFFYPFIHTKHAWNKYHMAGVTQFVSAGWTNGASSLHHGSRLFLLLLCGRPERPGPPQSQSVVLSVLLRWHHSFTFLAVRGRVTVTFAGPRELTLPAGCGQQWHEGMNTVEEKDGGTDGKKMENGRKWKCRSDKGVTQKIKCVFLFFWDSRELKLERFLVLLH